MTVAFYFGIYAGAPTTSVRQRYYLAINYPTSGAAQNNYRLVIEAGANYNTSLSDGVWAGDMPTYYKIIYDHSTRATSLCISFDGLRYFVPFGGVVGGSSGFTTTPPVNFQIIAQAIGTGGAAFAYIDIDWIRFTTP